MKRFVMDYAQSIAQTIFGQIFWSVDKCTYFSWGVSSKGYTTYKGMPALVMKVHGLMHKGLVIVALNEGLDEYEIYLFKNNGALKHKDTCYCDNLGQVLDHYIEKPQFMTDDEYRRQLSIHG